MAALLLDAAAATGAGSAWAIRMGVKDHTVQCIATGAPTAVTTELEGSLNGITWYQLAAHKWTNGEIDDGEAMFHVTSKYVTSVRINLTILTGGTSPTVTCLYEGEGS